MTRRLSERMSTVVDAETAARIRAAADRYGLAVGVVVREAIASGLTTALERLRAQHRRMAGAPADPNTDARGAERVGEAAK